MVPAVPDITDVAVRGFQDFTKGLFGSLADMRRSDNQRRVEIARIGAEVKVYLETLDKNLQKSMKFMDILHAIYERQLDDSNLTFDEKRTLLNDFSNSMLRAIGC